MADIVHSIEVAAAPEAILLADGLAY